MGRALKRLGTKLGIVVLGVGLVAVALVVLLRAAPESAQEEIDTHSRARLEQVLHEATSEESRK